MPLIEDYEFLLAEVMPVPLHLYMDIYKYKKLHGYAIVMVCKKKYE